MPETIIGSVKELWQHPIKSMIGVPLEQAEITIAGILGDRGYGIIDVETGKVASAKGAQKWGDLLKCKAAYIKTLNRASELPPVQITLPNGTTILSDSNQVNHFLSAYLNREVVLSRTSPDDFSIEQFHPNVDKVNPLGFKNTVAEQKLGASLFSELDIDSAVPAGAFFDFFPMSIITTSTLRKFRELKPTSDFDSRRFRMNVIIESSAEGFIENDWPGGVLSIGDKVKLAITLSDPRCIMTSLEQADLPKDYDIIKTLVTHNRLQVGNLGKWPCAGVYASVLQDGAIQVGDKVTFV